MPDPQALYNAVKSGQVQLTDLNDSGKEALKGFMNQKQAAPFMQAEQTYGSPNLNPTFPTAQSFNPPAPVQQPQSLADKVQSFNAPDASGNLRTNFPLGFLNPLNDINRIENSPIMKTLQHGAGQGMGMQPSDVPAAQSTGSPFVNSVANVIGQGVGYLTNPAQIEQNVGNVFFNNPLVQKAAGKVGSLVGSKLPQNAFGRAVANTAEHATVGALGSAAYAPTQTLNSGQNPQDIPQNMLSQGLTGAALGGAGGALGSLAKSGLTAIGQKYAGTTIGDALNNFFNRNHPNATPEVTQPDTIPTAPTNPIRLKMLNSEDSFQSILPKVYQQATETMTPPLENQNELAKWVQGNLNKDGHNISLNEVRTLDYNDLSDMANEIKKGFNTYNVVRQTAHDMGYGPIFDQTAPSIKDQIAANAQKRVYGIYPDKVNIAKSDSLNMPRKPFEGQQSKPLNLSDGKSSTDAAVNPIEKDKALNADVQPSKLSDAKLSSLAEPNKTNLRPADASHLNVPPFVRDTIAQNNALAEKFNVANEIESLSAQRLTRKEVASRIASKLPNGVDANQLVTSVKSFREIPSMDDKQAFETWVNNKNSPKLSDAKTQDAVVQTKEPRIRDKVYNALDSAEQAARDRIKARGTTLNSLPIGEYTDHAIILAAKIGKGTIKLADATEYLVKQFGEGIRPHAKDILNNARNIVKETEKNVVNKEKFNKVEDSPTLPDTSSQIQSKTIKEKTSLGQKLNQAYIKTVDNVHRINQFSGAAKDAQGGTLRPSEDPYKLGLNARNADMQARQILEHNMIDSQGNAVGDSLMKISKQIPASKLSAFEDYQVAKHAPTRMARGESVYNDKLNMTIQKAKMITANYEKSNPEFAKVNEQYHNFDNQLGQHWLVDTGMLKQSQLEQYKQNNPDYTPNNRIFSDLEKNSKFGSKGGFTDQSKPVKQAEGSQRQIVSPLESRIEHVAAYVKTAKQNGAGQAIVKLIQRNPEALKGWAEIVHDEPKVNVNDILQKDGPSGLMEHVAQTLDAAKQKPDLTKGNIVSVLMNGEVVHLRIHDPQFLEAVGNLSPEAQPAWIEAVGKITHVMKTTTTGVNPIFGLTKNIWKDVPHAFIASKSTNNPVTFGKDLIGALVDVIGNRESYQSYKNMGGGHSSSLSADRNLLAQSKEKLVPSNGLKQTLTRPITKAYHKLENFNNAIETAPRLAEYNRIVRQGGGTYDSKVEGLHQANDLTVNFNKRGNYTKQLDSLFPYLNASVQGLDQLARMFKSNPVAASVKAAMAISVPTAILYAANHNDPNYQQLSNYIKDNNFLIPNGDGTFTKIPKPREMGMIFSSLIERSMRQWQGNDPKAFQDFSSNLIQNFAPPLVGGAISGAQQNGALGAPLGALRDSIAGPAINLGLNKDFANRPIVPQDLAKLSPKLQVDAKTSEPAKFLGNLTNTSPKQLDYLAKSYLGGIASLGVPLSTKGGSLGQTLKQQVTADPLYSNDIGNNFYNNKAKQDQAKSDAAATGIPPKRDLSSVYDHIAAQVATIRKQEKLIQASKLSQTDKNTRLRDLQVTMNKMLKAGTIK